MAPKKPGKNMAKKRKKTVSQRFASDAAKALREARGTLSKERILFHLKRHKETRDTLRKSEKK